MTKVPVDRLFKNEESIQGIMMGVAYPCLASAIQSHVTYLYTVKGYKFNCKSSIVLKWWSNNNPITYHIQSTLYKDSI